MFVQFNDVQFGLHVSFRDASLFWLRALDTTWRLSESLRIYFGANPNTLDTTWRLDDYLGAVP